jgi:hypothetical protein
MKLSSAARILSVALAAYIDWDVLLTPPAGLETRDPAKVTGLGIAVLGLLFVGLALGIVALALLFQRSPRAPIAIERVEWGQAVVAIVVVSLSFWLLRSGTPRTAGQ